MFNSNTNDSDDNEKRVFSDPINLNDLDGCDNPEEITSDKICTYPSGIWLENPANENGYTMPFQFKIINENRVLVYFEEEGRNKFWEGIINYALYQNMLALLIEKKGKETGKFALIDKEEDDDFFSLRYYSVINCSTISEAIEKSTQLMEELHEPLDMAMEKVESFLKRELGIN